jgi:hypothetical protein
MDKKFYKTTYTIVVLSEEPIPGDIDLKGLDYGTDEGEYVGGNLESKQEEVSASEMARLLVEFGSEPAFFRLYDEDIEEVLEWDGKKLQEARNVLDKATKKPS